MKTGRIHNLIIASIILTLATVILTYYDIQKNEEGNGWISHTYEVIQESTELLSLMKDAETGQRGYLITGDTSYLRPYHDTQRNQLLHFNRLLELTRDNPQQQELLRSKISPFMALKALKIVEGIQAYDRFGRDSAFAVIRTNSGKRVMDSLRWSMKVLTDRENGLLAQRYLDLEKFYAVVDTVRYVSLVVISVVSLLALLALYKKQKQNTELVLELTKFNLHLEEQVAARTAELNEKNRLTESLNEELQQSMEEIKAFYEALQVQNMNTEGALQEARDLYNQAACGYHSLDANGIFVRINATELEWLGYERDEVIGKMRIKDMLSKESSESWQKTYDAYKVKGSVFNAELHLVRKDGSILPVLLSSSALYDVHGNFVMSRSTIVDLTERKEIELRLKEVNQNLIKVNQEKNNFLGMASHDLKSPLNSVLGLINLMKLESASFSPDQLQNLNLIFDSAKRMKAMIDKLLDLNRIEQGKAMVQNTEVELVGLIELQLAGFQAGAAKKNIQLVFEDHPPSLHLSSDAALLQQILDNLVSNALKFSLENKKVWVSAVHHGDQVIVEVRDQGPGIKPEEFHRLFGKFQKLSARPTAGETSSGLGLSIVKELVTVLGGEISCQSAVGVGTVFTVELKQEIK